MVLLQDKRLSENEIFFSKIKSKIPDFEPDVPLLAGGKIAILGQPPSHKSEGPRKPYNTPNFLNPSLVKNRFKNPLK